MANTGKWKAGASSAVSELTTELNGLANVTMSTLSAAYDNAGNLDLYVNIEVFLSTFTPVAGGYVTVFYVPTLDGTNYADSSVNYTPQVLCSHPVDAGTSVTRRIIIPNIQLPPLKGKFGLYNATGASLAGTSNTVKISTYNIDLNG